MPLETLLRNRSRDGSRDVGKFDLRKQNKNQSIETESDMKQIKRQRHTTAVITMCSKSGGKQEDGEELNGRH